MFNSSTFFEMNRTIYLLTQINNVKYEFSDHTTEKYEHKYLIIYVLGKLVIRRTYKPW